MRALSVLLLVLALVPVARAQRPAFEDWFPGGVSAPAGGDGERDLERLFRLLNRGSATDRHRLLTETRGDPGFSALRPALHKVLRGKNQLEQAWVVLLLTRVAGEDDRLALERFVATGPGGARGLAALALGVHGDPASVAVLARLLADGRPEERLMAALALGRLGDAAAGSTLRTALREGGRRQREVESLLLGLAMLQDESLLGFFAEQARPAAKRPGDRMAAVLGLGLLPASDARDDALLLALGDDEQMVREAALSGLWRSGGRSEAVARRMAGAFQRTSVREEALRLVVRAQATGMAAFEKDGFVLRAARSGRPELRAAAAAAGLAFAGQAEAEVAAILLLRDDEDRVARQALLTLLAHRGARQGPLDLRALAAHPDAELVTLALHGVVWREGQAAHEGAWPFLDPRQPGPVREAADRARRGLLLDPAGTRDEAWASLQMALDDSGFAPSFLVHDLLNRRIIALLDLEDALKERGSGDAPGGTGGGSTPGAPRPPPGATTTEQDLRRHLDAHPYMDRRGLEEIDLPRTPVG